MKRKASAEWQKNLKEGKGTITTESKVLESAQYSFSTRFEEGKGTNPEELIAAAHAGCFSMALSHKLSELDTIPTLSKPQPQSLSTNWKAVLREPAST